MSRRFDQVVEIVCSRILDNPVGGNGKSRNHQTLKVTPFYKSMSFVVFVFFPQLGISNGCTSEASNKELYIIA
jgi:hypothetical protein